MWELEGREHKSAVAYNGRVAEERRDELEGTEGVTNVRIVPVKPGE